MTGNVAEEFDRRILPNELLWGPGYNRPYTQLELDVIARTVAATRFLEDSRPRLFGRVTNCPENPSRLWLPPGYDASRKIVVQTKGHYFNDPVIETSYLNGQLPANLQEAFAARGWQLDQHGRPCHPHLAQLLGDQRIGLNTGLGHNPFYGERVACCAVVNSGRNVLLVERYRDGKIRYSLPMGRVIASDYEISKTDWDKGRRPVSYRGILVAIRRIVNHRTGLRLDRHAYCTIIDADRMLAITDTVNSWTATYNFRFNLAEKASKNLGRRYATWLDRSKLNEDQISPSHWQLIQDTI